MQFFLLPDILYNETGIYDSKTHQPINDKIKPSKSLIRYPYVFQIDEYLPIFRIYDQNKTLLAEYSALDPTVPNYLDDLVCPDFTFAYKGTCILQCPQSYFHEMNGTKGRCSLSPESEFKLNINNRTIFNPLNSDYDYNSSRGCPSPSKSYPYGCYCGSGTYFDRTKWICTTRKY